MNDEKKLEWQIAIASVFSALFFVAAAAMAVAATFFGWMP